MWQHKKLEYTKFENCHLIQPYQPFYYTDFLLFLLVYDRNCRKNVRYGSILNHFPGYVISFCSLPSFKLNYLLINSNYNISLSYCISFFLFHFYDFRINQTLSVIPWICIIIMFSAIQLFYSNLISKSNWNFRLYSTEFTFETEKLNWKETLNLAKRMFG